MATCQNTPSAGGAADGENLRWLVEVDRRKGAIALHTTGDMTRANRMLSTLWLEPTHAETVARAILAAVDGWRADQAAVAWTESQACGGAS